MDNGPGTKRSYRQKVSAPWVLLPACALLLAALVAVQMKTGREPVTLGAVLSLSGPASHLTDIHRGMRLALDEENQRGGIHGKPINLIVQSN